MARIPSSKCLFLYCAMVTSGFAATALADAGQCVDAQGQASYFGARGSDSACEIVAVAAGTERPVDAAAPPEGRRLPARLPIGFRGDSIFDLVARIEGADKASSGGVVATNYVDQGGAPPSKIYRLVVPPELNPGIAGRGEVAALDYDAHAQVMAARLWSGQQMFRASPASPTYNTILLARTWAESSYTAQNMLGAKTQVTAVRSDEYGLALTNVTPQQPIALLASTIPMRVDSAREAADDLAFYVDVRLQAASEPGRGLLRDVVRQRATMSNPYDWVITQRFLPAELLGAGLFRRSTGEILTSTAFRTAR